MMLTSEKGIWKPPGNVRVYLVLIVVSVVYAFYWLHMVTVDHTFLRLVANSSFLHHDGLQVNVNLSRPTDTVGCLLPHLDPFDKTIRSYIHKSKPLNCNSNQPQLTSLNGTGFLQVSPKVLSEMRKKWPNMTCEYFDVWLANDNKVAYGGSKVLNESLHISTDTCLVQCKDKKTVVYENVHIYPKMNLNRTVISRIPKTQPSIFLLAIDSMSQPNFIRQMPKTYKYLRETLGAVVLKGITKVGDNTFPNIVPLLTGLRVSSDAKFHEFPWPRNKFRHLTMDKMPLLWHSFRKAGYLTLYAEDMPKYALFNFVSKGFLKTPVDYYMRPFWIASEKTQLHRKSRDFCFGSASKHQLIIRYARQFLRGHSQMPYFAFAFISEITHGNINKAQLIDDGVYQLLHGSMEEGILNDTILIVMGDHGNRFDSIRSTVYGRLEERMPFFSIRLPDWLDEKYPYLYRNLRANSDRLTSWFDVHEMLLDVNLGVWEDGYLGREQRHGLSLWRQLVPENRTCDNAGVLQEYCVCVIEQVTGTDSADVKKAAAILVAHVNELLKPVANDCHSLTLKRVVSSAKFLPNKSVQKKSKVKSKEPAPNSLRLVVETSPNDALLEGLLQRGSQKETFHVTGDVNRINKYGDQSDCIRHPVLRLYCLCKNNSTVSSTDVY